MNFLGVGGLEFLLIFAVAMFFLGPKRLAEGVRTGRKYYTELKRYRQELTSLVTEAIDAEDLKKDLEQMKKDAWDDDTTKQITDIEKDLKLDQYELEIMRSVPIDQTSSKAKAVDRGDGKVDGTAVPSIDLESGGSRSTSQPTAEPEPDKESGGAGSA